MLRLVAGLHRGRRLAAPPGETTRPTSDRVRQAVFDMLLHAPWADSGSGDGAVEGQRVLDAFAGSGALGLEALSRGAAHACFLESDRVALAVLRQNVAALKEEARCTVLGGDVLRPRPAPAPCGLVVAETGREEALSAPGFTEVAARDHGAARVAFLRAAQVVRA